MISIKRRDYIIALSLATAALVLRLIRLGTDPLWLDEALSVHFVTTRSYWSLLTRLPLIDPHPPLYYLLLKITTTLFGTSEVVVRAPSVVAGAAAVGLLYLIGRLAYDQRTGVITASIAAISPYLVGHSQEARMYGLLMLLVTAATFALLLESKYRTRRTRVFYIGAVVSLGYTHVWGLFVVAAHALYEIALIAAQSRSAQERFRRMIVTFGGIVVLLSPWLIVLIFRASGIIESTALSYGPPNPLLPLKMPYFWMGIELDIAGGLLCLIIALSGAAWLYDTGLLQRLREHQIGLYPLNIRTKSPDLLFALTATVPVATGFAVSYGVRPIFSVRATIVASIGFLVLLGRGLALLNNREGRWLPFKSGTALIFILILTIPLGGHYTASPGEEWATSGDIVEQTAGSDDLVIVTDAYMQVPYAYYTSSLATTRTLAQNPNREIGVKAIYPSLTDTELQPVVKRHDRVIVVTSHISHRQRAALVNRVAAIRGAGNHTTLEGIHIAVYN